MGQKNGRKKNAQKWLKTENNFDRNECARVWLVLELNAFTLVTVKSPTKTESIYLFISLQFDYFEELNTRKKKQLWSER